METAVDTPQNIAYSGLRAKGEISAVVILRGGAAFETAMRRVLPDCTIGRMLIQSNRLTGEPELHFLKMSDNIHEHEGVILLDARTYSPAL